MSAPQRSETGRTSGYRRILGVPGARAFSAAGLIARLPLSMVGLGIVILVSTRTGSYATAGGVSASYLAGSALGAVPLARFVDRRGQARVLGAATALACAALVALIVTVEAGGRAPVPHVFAATAGLLMPNVGAAVRARWAHVLPERGLLDTAFALEAVNDELVFIVGPTLTTLLATAIDPAAGLVTAVTAALVGTGWFVLQRRTEPPRHVVHADAVRPPMPWLSLAPLVACSVLLGALFGGCEVATVAFADERGHKGISGLLLGIWAFGSMVSGLVTGGISFRSDAPTRHRWAICTLAALMVPLPFLGALVPLGGVLFLAGLAISPTLIAAITWVEGIVPAPRLNEGMAFYTTGLVLGVAPGAAITGAVVDAGGASAAYWVPVTAGCLGAVIAALTRSRPRANR